VSLQIPRKEPPNRAPAKRDAPFPEPTNYLLKFAVNRLSSFPNGPLWRETSVSRTLFYTFPSKSQVNEPPSMFPNRVPMEREASSPEPMVYSFIHSFISVRVPNTEPSHKKGGGYLVTVHGAPRGWKAYIRWGAVGFPKWGIVYDTAGSTKCHAVFSTIPSTLAWVDHSSVNPWLLTTTQ
jgi:hypothetical protein